VTKLFGDKLRGVNYVVARISPIPID